MILTSRFIQGIKSLIYPNFGIKTDLRSILLHSRSQNFIFLYFFGPTFEDSLYGVQVVKIENYISSVLCTKSVFASLGARRLSSTVVPNVHICIDAFELMYKFSVCEW